MHYYAKNGLLIFEIKHHIYSKLCQIVPKKKKKNLGTSIQNQYFIIILIQNEAYLRKFKFKTLKLRSSTVIAHEISASYTYGKRSFLPLV